MNIDCVLDKMKLLKGVSKGKDLAFILGLSPQDFSNRKKIGTLLPVIFEWAINENVNLNSLFKENEQEEKAISPRAAALLDNYEVLNEEDKRAFERMALTLAECKKITRKVG